MRVASIKTKTYCFGQSPKFVLWLQGCLNSCPGCVAPEWQKMQGGYKKSVNEIVELILSSNKNNNIEGVVISGGEPLLQYKKLCSLMDLVSAENIGIIVYTGFCMDKIKREFAGILKFADIIISGQYIEKYNNGKGLCGSTNQYVTFLSKRYQAEKEYFNSGERMLEIDVNTDSISFCGIPMLDSAVLIKE